MPLFICMAIWWRIIFGVPSSRDTDTNDQK